MNPIYEPLAYMIGVFLILVILSYGAFWITDSMIAAFVTFGVIFVILFYDAEKKQ